FLCRLLHLKIILLKKPLRTALCNKALYKYRISLNISKKIRRQSDFFILMSLHMLRNGKFQPMYPMIEEL
ncbi:hypothetical protein FPK40_09775, partial [Acinetobacter baumannii]|nr:hypothetical protein [Acinetobacter baumannii]MDR5636075.1 hypothetical protein [Acinetobacter baumannii]MDR8255616.1 hypothetical protein [Acinetobacter baumannii]MDR8276531.1 hypothetical protein [Acinetobacter baumannii]MDR8286626.1 hypothetical protein [Acinetobacter baumannii]